MTAKYDLIIKGGQVVFSEQTCKMDIAIKDGLIVRLEKDIDDQAESIVDATDRHILPGGVDAHTHFHDPGRDWEGFKAGSQALAAGGTTTYFDMPLNGIPPTINAPALNEKVDLARKESCVDFGLYGGLTPDGSLSDLEDLAKGGVIGFKAFMAGAETPEFRSADDLTLWRGMKKIAELNKILTVHCESDPLMQQLTKEKLDAGLTTARDYAESRPLIVENEATNRALYFAEKTGCKTHIAHASNAEAVEMVQRAKDKGLDVTVETCPHYLLFNLEDFDRLGVLGKCTPPVRAEEERLKLWESLKAGKIDMIVSDHAPLSKKGMATGSDVNVVTAFGGLSGGQFLLETIVNEAHINQGIPLTDIAKWTSTNAAKRFGIYPQKGNIFIGSDADLVLLNLNTEKVITNESMYSKGKHSPYAGRKLKCAVTHTISRGEVVYTLKDGFDTSVRGKWLKM